jgi:uncharacterized repeat protein (TIGR03803 family)
MKQEILTLQSFSRLRERRFVGWHHDSWRLFVATFWLSVVSGIGLSATAHGQSYTVLHSFSVEGEEPGSSLLEASDGKLYGTTNQGGQFAQGTVCVLAPDGTGSFTFSILHDFQGFDGGFPSGSLIEAVDSNLYGTTLMGGIFGIGTVFKMDFSGNVTTLHSFLGTDGSAPDAGLLQAADGSFYGTTSQGGANNLGTVFKMDPSGHLTTLHSFSGPDGIGPAALIQASDGRFYGSTSAGGPADLGTIFSMDSSGSLTTLHGFGGTEGSYPSGVVQAADGNFYGVTSAGGSSNFGTVFKMGSSGTLTTLYSFTSGTDGGDPGASLLQANDGYLYGTTFGYPDSLVFGTVFRIDVQGNFVTLHTFTTDEGGRSGAALIQASDGKFYGTGFSGGTSGLGTVFSMNAAGGLTTLHTLAYRDGSTPAGNLIQASDGYFYGATIQGGFDDVGIVYKMDALGNVTLLHSLARSEGAFPYAGLIQAADGNFYGTTYQGGANESGTVFRVDSSGNFVTLHNFNGTDGSLPIAGVIQASDGNFYGTTNSGGAANLGTVFKVDSSGNLTTLYSFAGPDGANPAASLVQGTDGNFYGTASQGGPNNYGTVFRIDQAGNLVTLHSFDNTDGAGPQASLIQATDGDFYGTTAHGGTSIGGTVFKIDSAGNLTTLQDFFSSNPVTGVMQGVDGSFYGTAVANTFSFGYAIIFKMGSSGTLTTLHYFGGGSGGDNPTSGLLQASDGSFYGTANGGNGGLGLIFRLCLSSPQPSITVSRCVAANASGLAASTPGIVGDTYTWVLTGGSIDSGQSTDSITFTSGNPGTLMTLEVIEANASNCPGSDIQSLQVDFADVPSSSPFHSFICSLARNGVTGGCGGGNFCPANSVSRAQMAVFLLRSEHGISYAPPQATGIFADVSADSAFGPWIEQIYREGITGGCNTNPLRYCPTADVTRGTMAVFLLVTEHGNLYTPPACTPPGQFADVPCPGGGFTNWIYQLVAEGITGGCTATTYCPTQPVSRAQMAVFLVTAFSLP